MAMTKEGLRHLVIDIVADSRREDGFFLVKDERIEALCRAVGIGSIRDAEQADADAIIRLGT